MPKQGGTAGILPPLAGFLPGTGGVFSYINPKEGLDAYYSATGNA